MKISIVIHTGGNEPTRLRNLSETLRCCYYQSHKDIEIIVVEQSVDGKFYCDNLLAKQVTHIKIIDPKNGGYNPSWARNVGIRAATNSVVVIIDSDFVFDNNFIERVSTAFVHPFSCGATKYYYANQSQTDQYVSQRNLDIFNNTWRGWTSFDEKNNVCWGGTLCFDRDWYLNVFGGYCENFEFFGFEDNEAADRIMKVLSLTPSTVNRIEAYMIHLSHTKGNFDNIEKNKSLKLKLGVLNPNDVCKQIVGSGNVTARKIIEI